MKIKLDRAEQNAEETFAKIVAELVRQGVQFEAVAEVKDFVITFTGGH